MDERKRDSIIAYLRHRMEEFGIEPGDLALALASDQRIQMNARYKSATGDAWSGEGEMPQWLKQAVSAGQSLDHFERPSQREAPTANEHSGNWHNDPFAGSRLARQKL